MAVKQKSGWGGLRGTLVAATLDVLAIRVPCDIARTPTLAVASFVVAAPSPAQAAGKARLLLYTGNEPTSSLSPADANAADGLPFISRVWLDTTIAYGFPYPFEASGGLGNPEAERAEDWWLVLGTPLDSAGVAFNAVATLTLWGIDDMRRFRFR